MLRIIIALLLLPSLVFGATITGTVYDLELEASQAIVTVDTEPEQRVVAKEGLYSFNLPEGEYTIKAEAEIDNEPWVSEETVVVSQDGAYILDMILLPDFNLDDIELEDEEIPELDVETPLSIFWFILMGIIGIVLFGYYFVHKKEKKALDEDDDFRKQVISVIKKHKGRITQKELRKELPFSEAKASLVIAELESEGRLQKIKKGRGNILIWNK